MSSNRLIFDRIKKKKKFNGLDVAGWLAPAWQTTTVPPVSINRAVAVHSHGRIKA